MSASDTPNAPGQDNPPVASGEGAPAPESAAAASADVPQFRARPGSMSFPAGAMLDELAVVDLEQPVSATDTVLQGRYRIVGLLGKGGFGAVYRVEDLRLPGKFWALKELVFRDQSQIAEAQRSFEREARMLSTLMHRSLPVIVDFFSEGSRTYLLMEEIEGRTLSQLVEAEGPVREIDALRWALEMARVMDYLHNQEPPVIFRDIKPDNVMITNDGHVKLIDFGLARFFDPGKKRDTSVVGSVGYAPPEIWEDSMQTDARSDIYSFGATLYYVLTGHPPSPVYGTHKLDPYRKDLNPGFAGLVLRCMSTRPEERYQTAGEIIRELMLLLSSSSEATPLMQEELRSEYASARQPRRSVESVAVATAKAQKSGGREFGLVADRMPLLIPAICVLATVLFLVGAVYGYRVCSRPSAFIYDTPYELVNPDKDEGKRLMAKGDYGGALSRFDSALTRHPGDAEAHILRGNVALLLANKEDCIHIPAFMSLTGVDAPEAYRLLYGIAIATDEFNRAGGVNGRMAMIDIYDDGSDLERAVTVAEKIEANPKYDVVLGPYSSQRTLALAALFNNWKLPILAPVVSVPEVWYKGRYVYSASDTNSARVKAVAAWMLSRGYKRAGVLVDQDSALSAAVAEFFYDSYAALGGQVVAKEKFSGINFDKNIANLRAAKADCVFFSDYRGTVLAHFAKDLHREGLELPIASQIAPFTKDLVEAGGKDVEGVVTSGYFHTDSPREAVRTYSRKFAGWFELSPSHLDATAYDCCKIIFDAYKSGVKTREEMCNYLGSIGENPQVPGARPNYKGVTGEFSLARRLDMREVYLIEIRNGRYELLSKSEDKKGK